MSRIEQSKVAMNLRELSVSDLVEEVCAIIEPQATDAGLLRPKKKIIVRSISWGFSADKSDPDQPAFQCGKIYTGG